MTKERFNIYEFLKTRPLSWSAISSFEYDPEQWYNRYILSMKDTPSPEMIFGKLVGEKLASDPTFLPQVPRYKEFEYELKHIIGKGDKQIPMIGFIDSYEPHRFKTGPAMYEYKTGVKLWNQKRADEHGQISMYLLMLYLQHKINPEKVSAHILWLPTQKSTDSEITFVDEKDVRTFKTHRSMVDVLEFGQRIQSTVVDMQNYVNFRQ